MRSDNLNQFQEAKQKKERGVTVKDTLESALKEADDIESIVIVNKYKDGVVGVGFSWESSLESLGMLEVGKDRILSVMQE